MVGYGSLDDGGYNDASKSYKSNPTLERYVRLRRHDPRSEIEIAVVGGLDQLFYMQPELEKHGIDPLLVASVLDSDADAISELSLQLMEKMIEASNRTGAGETHLASRGEVIPDKLINWLISCALDALSWNDNLHIPRELIVLIRERLGGASLHYEKASRAHQMRLNAITVGGQIKARGGTPTFRHIAKILGVSPSTVMRWFPKNEFSEEVERVATWFDAGGKLISPARIRGLLREK
jgi:hypothetical protein